MKNLSITKVENAFMPAKEINDVNSFAGRESLIISSYLALLSEGTYIAVFGNRGIGKSSLARQISYLASGNNQLLKNNGYQCDRELDFLTIYYACGDSIDNYETLLRKLLTTNDCLADWVYNIPTAYKEIEKINGGFNAGIAKISGDLQTESQETPIITTHDIDVIFTNIVKEIVKQKITQDGILIIIDEYDRIKDHQGFAAFLKSASTNIPQVKFCIVGVAQDLQELLKSHESSDRLFAGGLIFVPPMSEVELNTIINNAEDSIDRAITYDEEARKRIISLSQGHPYIVHLIGKYSLRKAFIDKKELIDKPLISEALNQIAYSNVDPILESRYKKAVKSSVHREIVLKVFAEQEAPMGEIHTLQVYKNCLERGIENPSVYVGQLVLDEYGAELIKVRDTFYRFKDSLFKAYATAHPSLDNV